MLKMIGLVSAAFEVILRPPDAVFAEGHRSRREFVFVFVQNGHTGVTFNAENDRPGPGSLRGHFEATRGRFLRLRAAGASREAASI